MKSSKAGTVRNKIEQQTCSSLAIIHFDNPRTKQTETRSRSAVEGVSTGKIKWIILNIKSKQRIHEKITENTNSSPVKNHRINQNRHRFNKKASPEK